MASEHLLAFSDLHIDAKLSEIRKYLPDIISKIKNLNDRHVPSGDKKCCILNGDIFDFDDRTVTSRELTDAAVQFLARLVTDFPDVHFLYLLGNHDDMRLFTEKLGGLSQQHTNFEVEPSFRQFGDVLFLHGDLAIGYRRGLGGLTYSDHDPGITRKRYRDDGKDTTRKDVWRRRMETWAAKLGPNFFDYKAMCECIYLDICLGSKLGERDSKGNPLHIDTVQQVCFGHIHPMKGRFAGAIPIDPQNIMPADIALHDGLQPSDLRPHQIRFYNTGCAIEGFPLQTREFLVTDGKATEHSCAVTEAPSAELLQPYETILRELKIAQLKSPATAAQRQEIRI